MMDEEYDDTTDPGEPYVDDELLNLSTRTPLMPCPFPTWFPSRNQPHDITLRSYPYRAFIPERLLVTHTGGRYWVSFDETDEPQNWIESFVFEPAAFGVKLNLKAIPPEGMMSLHVRWEPPPEVPAWRRMLYRVLWWVNRPAELVEPSFNAMMLGRLVL